MPYKIFVIIFFQLLPAALLAQSQKSDSLLVLLSKEGSDTAKVNLMCELAKIINGYDPGTALIYAQNALNLSKEIKYNNGQSRSLGEMAYIFTITGNYPKALELNLQKLKLDEKGDNPYNLIMSLNNIGIVYSYQENYSLALTYHYRADSVIVQNSTELIRQNKLDRARYYVYMNVGDVYNRLGNDDSAFSYFNKSLILSNNLKDDDFIGNAMTGLGHTYFKKQNAPFSLLYYQTAISYLQKAKNYDVLCEATLGLAKLYQQLLHMNDSAIYYALRSLQMAENATILPKQLEAVNFLTNHYKTINKIDSAYYYLNMVIQLNDSINSKDRIRELQLMSSNESLRQQEMEEGKRIAKKERKQQLQLLFIGIFIPGFFLLTLLLSKIRIHYRVIKILGIVSLLILFEYLTLLLHPTVAAFTNHTPVYEMFIFVAIAAILIPGHHRLEKWLIKKLIRKNGSIKLRKIKFKVQQQADLPKKV